MRNVTLFRYQLCGVLVLFFPIYSSVRSQSPDDDKLIRMVVEGYLKAKDWKERLAFVHDAPKQEDAMKAKYEGVVFQLQNQSVQKIEEIEKHLAAFADVAPALAAAQQERLAVPVHG